MRVVIVGGTGNAGTALVRRLRDEAGVELVGVVRRVPPVDAAPYDAATWHSCDVAEPGAANRLTEIFRGADAVVHLAWQIQPSHDQRRLFEANALGSRAVAEAVARAGVKTLVVASSVGVYSPGPKRDAYVTEAFPRNGVPGSSYSRQKAMVERLLDRFETDNPTVRVVRVRPGLIFQRDAGTEIARYFAGPLLPARLLRFGRIPVVPDHPRLRVQAVHADDVAEAYARIVLSDARGAFNLAAGPVLDPQVAARVFRGVTVPVPGVLLRAAADLTWRMRLQPVDVGWVKMGLKAPLMSAERARSELGWRPAVDAVQALEELVAGLAEHAGTAGPPLSPEPSLPGRAGGLRHGRLPGVGNPY